MQNQPQAQVILPKLQKSKRSSRKELHDLPPIPDKLYFAISEVGKLCQVKPYVLRYWEQEFSQLRPTTRRGKRRYYQRADILLIRRIKSLLYEQGFTIEGARVKLASDGDESKLNTANLHTIKLTKSVISKLNQILSDLL